MLPSFVGICTSPASRPDESVVMVVALTGSTAAAKPAPSFVIRKSRRFCSTFIRRSFYQLNFVRSAAACAVRFRLFRGDYGIRVFRNCGPRTVERLIGSCEIGGSFAGRSDIFRPGLFQNVFSALHPG